MKFTFIFLFLFGVSLICLVEGKPPNAPASPAQPQNDDDDEEFNEDEEEAEEEAEEEPEDEEEYPEEEEEDAEDEYELEEGAEEDYYDDETEAPTTLPPTTTTTTKATTTTTKPTTTTTKSTTTSTTTKPTTTSTTTKATTTTSTSTTTVDPRKALEPKIMNLLNSLSALQTAVSSATVQDEACQDSISSSLVAYLASGLQLETNIYNEPYSKDVKDLTTLEGNLSDISKDWAECLARTTSTTSTTTSTTTEKPTTTSTTTEATTSTTEATTSTTETTTTTTEATTSITEATTTTSEEKKLKFIPGFTIDPPKAEYAQEPNSAEDDEIQKQLMDEIKRTEDMIEKQKHAIIVPMAIEPAIEEPEDVPEPTEAPITTTTIDTATNILTTPSTSPKPHVTNIKKVDPATTTTTARYVYKHMIHPKKSLRTTKDKAPPICTDSMDLYSGNKYSKSVCVINRNMSYEAGHDLCLKEEMDLFAIQTIDHHLECRLNMFNLFENVHSYWINGRKVNDFWYYFSSENNGQKRFIYPGTQFDGPQTGNCLRLMKFEEHNTVAANAANCNMELPVFCEYYIQ
ncbi:unnamed protein product [Chironomus riparius]|uniref:C-type lectin domain-containing protein n=1 Tax=Chironomus riparius TaxID=315576 RepID=A0A9N9S7W8_9DIPT|nr:unnamed protein product [Chironomus riparius]